MMNNAVNEHSYFVNEEAKAQKRKNDLKKHSNGATQLDPKA